MPSDGLGCSLMPLGSELAANYSTGCPLSSLFLSRGVWHVVKSHFLAWGVQPRPGTEQPQLWGRGTVSFAGGTHRGSLEEATVGLCERGHRTRRGPAGDRHLRQGPGRNRDWTEHHGDSGVARRVLWAVEATQGPHGQAGGLVTVLQQPWAGGEAPGAH